MPLPDSQRALQPRSVTVSRNQVSDHGEISLPAETRRRWDLADGGTVEIADLGSALLIVPTGRGGLRSIIQGATSDAGGYGKLVAAVTEKEPDLA